jgi:hypothetical protein
MQNHKDDTLAIELHRQISQGYNIHLKDKTAKLSRENRRLRRENWFLIALTITLIIWAATPI